MNRTSAQLAARLTGQPPELYLDDARADGREAEVHEVPAIEYPVDQAMVREAMEASGKGTLILTDGVNAHMFRRTADGVAEVSPSRPGGGSGRGHLERILKVYRRNRRSGARPTDMLKGLLLFSKGLDPRDAGEADRELERLAGESGVRLTGFDDWEPVAFALGSLRSLRVRPSPGETVLAFMDVLTRRNDTLAWNERVGRVAASFVDGESTHFLLNPYVAACLPYGSIAVAACPGEEVTVLAAMIMGAKGIVENRGVPEVRGTLVCPLTSGEAGSRTDVLTRVLDALPEGGRLVMVEAPGVLSNIRSEGFRARVSMDLSLSAVVRVGRGLMPASTSDALVIVADGGDRTAPTEYAVVPEVADASGDWRTWEGVTFTERPADYGTDWAMGFEDERTGDREGPRLRDVAEVRKGSMIRSDELFPADSGAGIPFLRVRDVSRDGLDLGSARRASSSVRVVARPGDILVACNGMTDRVYRLRSFDPVVAPSYSLAIVTADGTRMLPEFLEMFLRTEDFREQAKALMTGNMTRTLSRDSLSRIVVPDADLGRQREIADRYWGMVGDGEEPDPDAMMFGENNARGGFRSKDRGRPCGAAEDGRVAGGRAGGAEPGRDRGDLLVLGPLEGRLLAGGIRHVEDLRVPPVRGRQQEDGTGRRPEDTERRGADAAGRRPDLRCCDRRREGRAVRGRCGREIEKDSGPARSSRRLKTPGHWATIFSIGVTESAMTQSSGSLRPVLSPVPSGSMTVFIVLPPGDWTMPD